MAKDLFDNESPTNDPNYISGAKAMEIMGI
jgi:hypothetical protein